MLPKKNPSKEPIYALQALIDDWGVEAIERKLNVHRTTVKRWLAGTVQISMVQQAVMQELLGHLPGTDGKWHGWKFWDGKLWGPNKASYTAQEIERARMIDGFWYSTKCDLELARKRIAELEAQLEGRVPANDAAGPRPLALVPKAV